MAILPFSRGHHDTDIDSDGATWLGASAAKPPQVAKVVEISPTGDGQFLVRAFADDPAFYTADPIYGAPPFTAA